MNSGFRALGLYGFSAGVQGHKRLRGVVFGPHWSPFGSHKVPSMDSDVSFLSSFGSVLAGRNYEHGACLHV